MGAQGPWPSEFSELKKLEEILQCPICYEYINTCMITSCSHNFCSLCIRKYLNFKTQCPTCFEETHGSDLRKNRLVDDIITIWTKSKDRLLFNVRLVSMTQSLRTESKLLNGSDPHLEETEINKKEAKSVKKELKTPKNDRNKKSVVQKLFSEKKSPPAAEEVKPIVVDGMVIPPMFQPHKSPKKSLVKKPEEWSTCPVCNVEIPLKNVNMHLDSCLAASDPASSRLKPKPEKRDPIPKRVYTMMKDPEIRKYLKDYGLSTHGNRKAMLARLNRYIVLYNAECDKEHPRAVSELIKQVEREEKDEKATQSNLLFQTVKPPVIPPDKKKDPELIEKANKEYLDLNKDNFKKLIEAMKAREGRNIKPLKPLNRINSDDEDESKPSTSGTQQLPSTSKASDDVECISVYSQETIADSGSDTESDMFARTPIKVEVDVHSVRQIDWNKTLVKEDDEIQTQPPEGTAQNTSVLSVEGDSDSYESVFNTSTVSDVSKTPSRLSLSARKRRKEGKPTPTTSPSTSKLGEKFDEIFENGVDGSDATTSNPKSSEVDKDETKEAATEDEETEDEDEDSDTISSVTGTPVKSYDISPEISPIKTRSAAKRKCHNSDEKTPNRATRQKRVKPSASPVY